MRSPSWCRISSLIDTLTPTLLLLTNYLFPVHTYLSHVKLSMTTEETFSWNGDELKQQLPLLPNHSITIHIHIFAKVTSDGGDFIFNYSSESSPLYMRSVTFSLPLRIKPGIEIVSFDILTAAHGSQTNSTPGKLLMSPLD
jgi:hypothetical protein